MKSKIVILVFFFFIIVGCLPAKAQIEGPSEALILTGGVSQITGFGGVEYFLGKSSLDVGLGTLTGALNGETRTTFGIGSTYYTAPENRGSVYFTVGWTSNGVVYDYWDSFGNTVTDWANSWTFMAGYRLAGNGLFSLKAGGGYYVSKYLDGWTFEVKLGLRLWTPDGKGLL